jgi:hypothetical protein
MRAIGARDARIGTIAYRMPGAVVDMLAPEGLFPIKGCWRPDHHFGEQSIYD